MATLLHPRLPLFIKEVLKIVNESISFGLVALEVIDITNGHIWQENCFA